MQVDLALQLFTKEKKKKLLNFGFVSFLVGTNSNYKKKRASFFISCLDHVREIDARLLVGRN